MSKVISVFLGKRVVALDYDSLLKDKKVYPDGVHKIKEKGSVYYVKFENGKPVNLSRKDIAGIMKEGGD